ncbi:MAG: 1-deoxy-D-xylulose-5-phosphate reductoisomerase [Candidatus Omnitrophica bacterium]|nr:1-deoxy-D-xylulose-5-phosphate reductoisomerase [Candidatus Omnitrophota bacterium]
MKRVAVLGSTGSIGTSTLDVIAAHPEALSLVGIAARSRIDVLEQQIARYHPSVVAVLDEQSAARLQQRCHGRPNVLQGIDGLVTLATEPSVDVVVMGTSGREALLPLIRAIQAGKQIALASKELLVMAGELVMRLVEEHHVTLIPVDSEHAALFQALQGVPRSHVERVVLTGSGGSLWSLTQEQRERASLEQVLRHPKWRMGPKITVDSATLMNKGLEVIEAQWLFGMPLDRIGVLIHPQALIHGMVEFVDGTALAHLSACDMRLPIQYALSFPQRWSAPFPRVRWTELSGLQFFEPDLERFPCLRLAWEAARVGGSACTVLSAANEAAVRAYLRGALVFSDIPRIIEQTLASHHPIAHPSLEEIFTADEWARTTAEACIQRTQPSCVMLNVESVM